MTHADIVTEIGEQLTKILNALGTRAAFDPSSQSVQLLDYAPSIIAVANLVSDYQRTPVADRHAYLTGAAQGFSPEYVQEQIAHWDLVKDKLFPDVRDAWFFHRVGSDQYHQYGNKSIPHWRPLGVHMGTMVAVDLPHTRMFVMDDMLTRWGQTEDVLFARALARLRASVPPVWKPVGDGVFQLVTNDGYAISRLLLPEIFRSRELPGSPIVTAPARDLLFVCGSDNHDGLRRLSSLNHKHFHADSRRFSPFPLQLSEDDEWRLPVLEADHPCHGHLREWVWAAKSMVYDQQAEVLGAPGDQPTFTKFGYGRLMDGPAASFTHVPDQSPALLPEVEHILITYPSAWRPEHVVVPWGAFDEAFMGLLQPVGMYPERYLLKQAPPLEHVLALGIAHPVQFS